MEKVYLYVHDEKGYGHLSRMLKIYHSLCPHYNVCILLSGTLKIHDSSIKYIQLPYVTEFEPRLLDRTPIEKDLKKRREFIERKLGKDEKFSLYIDYFPYGRHAFYKELDMLIDMSQSSGGQVFCVMRDIFIGEALFSRAQYEDVLQKMREYYYPKSLDDLIWSDKEKIFQYLVRYSDINMIVDIFLEYYLRSGKIDKVLVFGDSEVYDIRKETPLSAQHSDKFVFLGYLLSDTQGKQINTRKGDYILISAGGNIFDVKKFLTLLVVCSQLEGYQFKIVLGGMLEKEIGLQIRKRFTQKHMKFIEFSDNFSELLLGARVFIGGGGYGSCTDLIQYNIPGFLYVNHNDVVTINKTEQAVRIDRLSKHIDIQEVSSFDLETMKQILEVYQRGKKKIEEKIAQSGSSNLLKFLGVRN